MKLKRWLSFAGIWNIVLGIILFLISRETFVPVIFLVLSGFYYKTYFDNENAYEKRWSLLILGIINLLFNFISGIITLEIYGLIKKDEIYLESVNKKQNKINVLLQLGIVLVLLSGIMIATNQTILIPNIFKILGLILLSVIFFFLSYLSKKYLKLESSFKTYFILGISFIVISFIGTYYYNLLGSISLNSYNYLYFYPLLFLLIGICAFITGKVLKYERSYYLTVLSSFIVLFTWFNALGLNIVINLLIITLSVSFINCVYTPSCLAVKMTKDTSYYISLCLTLINMFVVLFNKFDLSSTILCLITTLNVFHLFIKNSNNILSIISIPTLLVNTLLVVFMNDDKFSVELLIFQVVLILFYNLIRFIKLDSLNNLFKKLYKIFFNIAIILTSVVSLFIDSDASIMIVGLMVFQNIIGIILNEKDELYSEPFKTLLMGISLVISFNVGREVDFVFNLFILEILELALYLLIKNKVVSTIHYVMYLVLIGNIVMNPSDNLFLSLIALISSIIPLILLIFKKDKNNVGLVFALLFMIKSCSNQVFSNIYYLNYLFVFVLMVFYSYMVKSDKQKKYMSLFASAILMLSFINLLTLNYSVLVSLEIIVYSYVGILIASLIDVKDSRDLFITLYFTIISLINIFNGELIINLVISVITILMIIFGFIKDFKKTKISAIILFILNLIYILKDFWKDIPLAIYLLVIGLLLIGVVIVKEIKENK